jgi:hypothetical protein
MATKTWDYLGKVQKLLNKADDLAATPEESAMLRAKAEELMRKYRIEEEELLATDATSAEPVYVEMDLCRYGSEFRQAHINMMWDAAEHAGVQAHFFFGDRMLKVGIVGYEGDARYATFLYSAARLVFSAHLEPEIDPSLSERENIWRLRSSGMERQRVARVLWGEEVGSKASAHAKVGKIYKEECAARGSDVAFDGKGIVLKDFRTAYARNFRDGFNAKLRQARDAADSVGGAMVLHGRKERVTEAFYVRFPQYRPTEVATTSKAPAKKERRWSQADERRYARAFLSRAATMGASAGRTAAEEIELSRTDRAKRISD